MRGAFLAAAALLASPLAAADFWVARDGDDSAPGTRERPFATLERAREAVRTTTDAHATVHIRGGVYRLDRTFTLSERDSGAEGAPVIWRAADGETVRFTGAAAIGGFTPVTGEAVLARLDPAARDRVMQTDLHAQGISDFGSLTARGMGRPVHAAALELFFNGEPMTLARWPNRGWARTAGAPAGAQGGRFTYEGDRPQRWSTAEDPWVHGYWTYDWADSYESVERVDTDARAIVTRPPHGVYGYGAGKRWRALNLLEELDEPGEWYLERSTGMLYFWPPEPVETAEIEVSVLSRPLVAFDRASHIILRGITFEGTRSTAVTVSGGAGITLAGCRFRNLGNRAVVVNGGELHTVIGCEISETGDGGISLNGGDRAKLIPSNHAAINNHIFNYSRWVRTYRPAVSAAGVGQRILRNLIHDAPHQAIQISGNEHLIEGNDIHSVALETFDVGAFYMGRDWTARGNRVQYNYFHNLGDGDTNGVYLDDCASGTYVFGNLFHRASRAVHLGGGRDNRIENNIFVDCRPSIKTDARAMTWASKWIRGDDPTLYNRLMAVPYQQPPWSERYPELVNILDDEPAVPKGNVIERNISWGGAWLELRDNTGKWVVVRDNFTGDPGFADAARNDFRLADDSPARALGILPLPLGEIGLYRDEHWPALPVAEVVHVRVSSPAAGQAKAEVENLGRVPSKGEIEIWLTPESAARVEGPERAVYQLEPGGKAEFLYSVTQAGDSLPSVIVGARRKGGGVTPAGIVVRLRQ